MTDPEMTAILCRLTRCTHDGPHPPLDRPWDEGEMQRMTQAADMPEIYILTPRKGRR